MCFVCAHQCHCYLGSTSSAPNCRAKTGAVGTDALNPHPIFTLSNRSGKEKERERGGDTEVRRENEGTDARCKRQK